MLKKTFKHRLVNYLCRFLNIGRLRYLEYRLDKEYDNTIKMNAELEMQEFLKQKGPEFVKELEEQNCYFTVPLSLRDNEIEPKITLDDLRNHKKDFPCMETDRERYNKMTPQQQKEFTQMVYDSIKKGTKC